MNALQIFENAQFGKIRVVEKDNEPWFVGKDIAKALGYKNTKDALDTHVDDEDKKILQRSEITTIENHIPKTALPVDFVPSDIPNRGLTIINESGLYSLVLSSKLPTAKKFRRWVTSEVLPSIRRTGGYTLPHKENEPVKQLQQLQTELQKWKQLEAQFRQCAAQQRKAYENTRHQRDMCRVNIQRLEQLIADCIGQLSSIPQIK